MHVPSSPFDSQKYGKGGEVLFSLLKRSGMEELLGRRKSYYFPDRNSLKSAILHFTHQKCLNYLPSSKKFKWVPGCQNWDFLRRLVIELKF